MPGPGLETRPVSHDSWLTYSRNGCEAIRLSGLLRGRTCGHRHVGHTSNGITSAAVEIGPPGSLERQLPLETSVNSIRIFGFMPGILSPNIILTTRLQEKGGNAPASMHQATIFISRLRQKGSRQQVSRRLDSLMLALNLPRNNNMPAS